MLEHDVQTLSALHLSSRQSMDVHLMLSSPCFHNVTSVSHRALYSTSVKKKGRALHKPKESGADGAYELDGKTVSSLLPP